MTPVALLFYPIWCLLLFFSPGTLLCDVCNFKENRRVKWIKWGFCSQYPDLLQLRSHKGNLVLLKGSGSDHRIHKAALKAQCSCWVSLPLKPNNCAAYLLPEKGSKLVCWDVESLKHPNRNSAIVRSRSLCPSLSSSPATLFNRFFPWVLLPQTEPAYGMFKIYIISLKPCSGSDLALEHSFSSIAQLIFWAA